MKKTTKILLSLSLISSLTLQTLALNQYKPTGCVDAISLSSNRLYVAGWAFDKDTLNEAVKINIKANGTSIGMIQANQTRNDVNNAFGITGSHGYSSYINTNLSGSKNIQIYALDTSSGVETLIGSKTINFPVQTNVMPQGCVDSITKTDNGIKVAGWAYDKDALNQAVNIKVYANNSLLETIPANILRDDVNKAFNITGSHGFSKEIDCNLQGTQTIKITMTDINTNQEITIKSQTLTFVSSTPVTTTKYTPTGCVDLISKTSNGIKVAGWAYDKDDVSKSIDIKVYANNSLLETFSANDLRVDVNNAFNITGSHGFSKEIECKLTGSQVIKVVMVDLSTNKETTIKSQTLTFTSSTPVPTTKYTPTGCVDLISKTSNGIKVAGWAYDKDDVSKSIDIKVYANNSLLETFSANNLRVDVNNAFNITGSHGFSKEIECKLTGSQVIKVVMVDLSTNKETTIKSQTIAFSPTITTKYTPTTCVDLIAKTPSGFSVAGWAYDKDDTSKSVDLKVYANGELIETFSANQYREDVNKAFGITGSHGFSKEIQCKLSGLVNIEIKVVDLGTNKEISIAKKSIEFASKGLIASVHVSNVGWMSEEVLPATLGDETNTIEAITIENNTDIAGTIEVQSYINGDSYQEVKTDGNMSGTTGQSKKIGGIKMNLTGELANLYDIYYAVNVPSIGWLDYACNGELAGLENFNLGITGIKIELIEKGSEVSFNTTFKNITKESTKFIAHRGYSEIAPENTIHSFIEAGKHGFYGCETDVYITSDDYFVCSHDPHLVRMASVDALISDMTLEQLQNTPITSGNNISKYPGTTYCSLEEYLEICNQYDMVPVIEIKNGPNMGTELLTDEQLELLYKQVDAIMNGKPVTYISFEFESLVTMREICMNNENNLVTLQYVTYDLNTVNKLDLINYQIELDLNYLAATKNVLDDYNKANINVGVWTCDNPSSAMFLIKNGVTYITTNKAYWD